MTFRSLILASAAAALVAVAPARAQTVPTTKATYSKAESEVETDAKKPAAKKAADKKAGSKAASKKTDKKQAKKPDGKTVAKKETDEKKPGLFATLFGGQAKAEEKKSPPKPMTAAEKRAAKAAALKADKEERAAKVKAEKEAKLAEARAAKEAQERAVRDEATLIASLDDDRPIELRSDANKPPPGLFGSLFGGNQSRMLPETERRDRYLKLTEAKKGAKKFTPKAELMPTVVDYDSSYKRGTIVVNTAERRLYLIESAGKARRYAIAVGRQGLEFKGNGKVGDKQEWPRWIPTEEMQKRDPKKYGQYKDGMDGGPTNPLGARAIYLYQGKKDTHIRVHGTTEPWTIGTSASNGCFRMINEHVMDLYNRVSMGADFVVL